MYLWSAHSGECGWTRCVYYSCSWPDNKEIIVRYHQELSRLIWLSLGTRIYFDKNLRLQQETQYHDNNHLSEISLSV